LVERRYFIKKGRKKGRSEKGDGRKTSGERRGGKKKRCKGMELAGQKKRETRGGEFLPTSKCVSSKGSMKGGSVKEYKSKRGERFKARKGGRS